MADMHYNPRGGLSVDRESLHQSEGYKSQVRAIGEMRKPTMTNLLDDLAPCPFCGGQGQYTKHRYAGTGASGMEPYTIYAGCPPCNVKFSGGDEMGWDSTRRCYDRSEEAHKQAAERWNTRANAAEIERNAKDERQRLPAGWKIEVRYIGDRAGLCVMGPPEAGGFAIDGQTKDPSDIRDSVIRALGDAMRGDADHG